MDIQCHPGLRAALYSDQVIAANRRVDSALIRLLDKPSPRVGYIPSAPDPGRRFFNAKVSYYGTYGIDNITYYDPAEFVSHREVDKLLECDAIHLSGGDTRRFLTRLRVADLICPLREYAFRGGILVGTSAGAILMTPTVAVETVYEGSLPKDEPQYAALDLLPFEFFPHFGKDPNHATTLLEYSTCNGGRLILACSDGDGVVVSKGAVDLIGPVTAIKDGRRLT